MAYNILIAAWGGAGHIGPTLAAADQLRKRGHRVRFISRADERATIEAAGFGFVAWQRTPAFSPIAPDAKDIRFAYDNLLFGPATARAQDTVDEIRRLPTDALISDSALFGSSAAAEAARIPCAFLSLTVSLRPLPGVPPLMSGMKAPRTPEDRASVLHATERYETEMNRWLPMLNRARTNLSLPPVDNVLQLFDRADRFLIAMSGAFDFVADHLPPNVRYIGPLLDDGSWSKPWQAPWTSRSHRLRVLISFSTTDQNQREVLQRSMNSVSGAGMDGVVTAGPAIDATTLDSPPHITVLTSAPHDAVMKEVSMVVTHGGHGTVSRALRHGLPLLVMPMGRDQNDIASRVEASGAGLALQPDASEADVIGALSRLATEPHFAIAAHRIAQAMATELGEERFVHEVEEMVKARQGVANTIIATPPTGHSL